LKRLRGYRKQNRASLIIFKRESVLEINVSVYTVISDHLPVCLNRFSGVHRGVNKHNSISYRAFKHLNVEEFHNELMSIDFNLIEMQNTVNTSFKLFYDIINGVLSKQAPIKQKCVQHPSQPISENQKSQLFMEAS